MITADVLWKVEAYRLSLFLSDLAWRDSLKLLEDRQLLSTADQLYRATGRISANIAEGYSRSSAKERAHYYEYALGSTREARDWYYKARHALTVEVASHRMELTTQIIRLSLTMINHERRSIAARGKAT